MYMSIIVLYWSALNILDIFAKICQFGYMYLYDVPDKYMRQLLEICTLPYAGNYNCTDCVKYKHVNVNNYSIGLCTCMFIYTIYVGYIVLYMGIPVEQRFKCKCDGIYKFIFLKYTYTLYITCTSRCIYTSYLHSTIACANQLYACPIHLFGIYFIYLLILYLLQYYKYYDYIVYVYRYISMIYVLFCYIVIISLVCDVLTIPRMDIYSKIVCELSISLQQILLWQLSSVLIVFNVVSLKHYELSIAPLHTSTRQPYPLLSCFNAFHGQYVNYGCHVSMPHSIHVHGRVCIYMCTCKSKQHCPDNTCLTVFIHCSLLCGIIPMHACYKAYCINGGGKQWGYLTYLSTG